MTPPAQLGASTVNPAATSAAARPYRQVIHLSCTFFYPPTIVQKKRLFDLKQKSQEIAFMPKDQDAQRRFCLWPLYWKPPPHLVDLNSGIFFWMASMFQKMWNEPSKLGGYVLRRDIKEIPKSPIQLSFWGLFRGWGWVFSGPFKGGVSPNCPCISELSSTSFRKISRL